MPSRRQFYRRPVISDRPLFRPVTSVSSTEPNWHPNVRKGSEAVGLRVLLHVRFEKRNATELVKDKLSSAHVGVAWVLPWVACQPVFHTQTRGPIRFSSAPSTSTRKHWARDHPSPRWTPNPSILGGLLGHLLWCPGMLYCPLSSFRHDGLGLRLGLFDNRRRVLLCLE